MSTNPNRLIGGQYLIKDASYNDIFTYEDLSEEQQMILQSAKEFIDKEVVPKKHQIEKKDYALIEELMRKIGELGLLGISVPEEYGGMGMGPMFAIPKALKQAGLKQEDIELFELNEAFASQSVAIMRELNLNPEIVNVNGGAIALGHPLGCSGTKLTVQLLHEMEARKAKYGMVTMCVGTGQGAASVFEYLK